jgi:hypothetical protein
MRPIQLATAALALLALAGPARAQSELDLRDAFEGRPVVVKIDLPGSDDGIDVYPQRRPTLDFPEYGKRMKRYGTAVRKGEEILVTTIRVKKNLIEFQLGGGGYGTFGDDTSPDIHVDSADKTQREKNLEQDLKREADPAKRRKIKEELDDLRRRRERENSRNEAAVAAAREEKERNIRQRRLEGGSRINVRFEEGVPGGALTPEGLRTALEEWVDFDGAQAQGTPVALPDPPAPPARGVSALAKGMSRADVEDVLGPATKVVPRREGTLQTETATFETGDNRVTALFVEGVLVRYTIASR